jgi:hypothetical protein
MWYYSKVIKCLRFIPVLMTSVVHVNMPYACPVFNIWLKYIGQTGRTFNVRYKEHIHAIRSNKSNCGYSNHIVACRIINCGLRIFYLDLLDLTSGELQSLNNTSNYITWTSNFFWGTAVTNTYSRLLSQTALADSHHQTALISLSLSLMLWPTVNRPVYLGIKHPSGAYDQIFISFWQLRPCFCGRPLWREDGSVVCVCCWHSPA